MIPFLLALSLALQVPAFFSPKSAFSLPTQVAALLGVRSERETANSFSELHEKARKIRDAVREAEKENRRDNEQDKKNNQNVIPLPQSSPPTPSVTAPNPPFETHTAPPAVLAPRVNVLPVNPPTPSSQVPPASVGTSPPPTPPRPSVVYVPGVRPALRAKSIFAMYVDERGKEYSLWERAVDTRRPFGSIIKLLDALVIWDFLPHQKLITVSETAISELEDYGNLRAGDEFSAQEFLGPLLIESSNDAAAAFAEVTGRNAFVALLKRKAREIGMRSTLIGNPTGLDHADRNVMNFTTARNLARLGRIANDRYPELMAVTATWQKELRHGEGPVHHTMTNWNELLVDPVLRDRIIGGKTGLTPRSGECLLLVFRGPNNKGYYVAVVLASPERFAEMKALTQWLYSLDPLRARTVYDRAP